MYWKREWGVCERPLLARRTWELTLSQTGLYWVILVCTGLYWDGALGVLGVTGLYWVILGEGAGGCEHPLLARRTGHCLYWLYWFVLVYIGMGCWWWWVILGYTGLYWGILGGASGTAGLYGGILGYTGRELRDGWEPLGANFVGAGLTGLYWELPPQPWAGSQCLLVYTGALPV